MMGFEIEIVFIRGTLPESCRDCPIMSDSYFCPLELTFTLETDFEKRPDWCPLRVLAENETIGVFRHVGKGKITPNTEMWTDDEVGVWQLERWARESEG